MRMLFPTRTPRGRLVYVPPPLPPRPPQPAVVGRVCGGWIDSTDMYRVRAEMTSQLAMGGEESKYVLN